MLPHDAIDPEKAFQGRLAALVKVGTEGLTDGHCFVYTVA